MDPPRRNLSPLSFSTAHEQDQLPPTQPRPLSGHSTFSIDSRSTLFRPGDFREEAMQNSLPSFYPSGSREGVAPLQGDLAEPEGRWKRFTKGWRIVILGSWLNILLILIPVSWGMTLAMKNTHGLTFSASIIALIPLVRLHDVCTTELAVRIGGNKTGLLNGTMSNFIEVIVAISALRKCELQVVQSTLIGSMLSKMLLVLGLCFFAGGMRFSEQGFDATATQVHSSLLSLSVGAVLLPAAYHFTLGNDPSPEAAAAQKRNILKMSHGVSIVLLFIYIAYLVFQFWSHTHLYHDHLNKKSSKLSTVIKEERSHRQRERRMTSMEPINSQSDLSRMIPSNSATILPPRTRPFLPSSPLASSSEIFLTNRDEPSLSEKYPDAYPLSTIRLVSDPVPPLVTREATAESGYSSSTLFSSQDTGIRKDTFAEQQAPIRKEPRLSWFVTIVTLVLVTGAVAVTVDWLVESMDGVSTTISKEWIGLILLPGISSIAECMTAVRVSVKDELSLSVSVAVGSTLQTALLVIPFTVILAWITNKPLSLLMDPFQSMVLYIAVHTVGYVVADGKSNWLEGVVLICLYVIIAVSFWFYPGSDLASSLAVCTVSN